MKLCSPLLPLVANGLVPFHVGACHQTWKHLGDAGAWKIVQHKSLHWLFLCQNWNHKHVKKKHDCVRGRLQCFHFLSWASKVALIWKCSHMLQTVGLMSSSTWILAAKLVTMFSEASKPFNFAKVMLQLKQASHNAVWMSGNCSCRKLFEQSISALHVFKKWFFSDRKSVV